MLNTLNIVQPGSSLVPLLLPLVKSVDDDDTSTPSGYSGLLAEAVGGRSNQAAERWPLMESL